MLDHQKVFDTVDHVIWGEKLWVSDRLIGLSYLSNRSQIVHVNITQSDPSLVTCAVKQGSILGPLLFLCYVNDMEIIINSKSKLLLYADAAQFCTHIKILR